MHKITGHESGVPVSKFIIVAKRPIFSFITKTWTRTGFTDPTCSCKDLDFMKCTCLSKCYLNITRYQINTTIMSKSIEEIAKGKLPESDSVKEILASGENLGLRIWRNEEPTADKETHSSDYETVGYVLKGKAELHIEGEVTELKEGDSYLVPKNTEHTYKILKTFTAVEATSPPANLQ